MGISSSLPSVAILGCGTRGGHAYGAWCAAHPEKVRVTGIADIDPRYRDPVQRALELEDSACYGTWEELLSRPRIADGLIIALTEDMRVEPLRMALEKGYDILIEKPVARSMEELTTMDGLVSSHTSRVMVCHVLRYQPFFARLNEILESGAIGRIQHLQHNENVGFWHFTHSYVRGVFRNEVNSGPIILAKTSHDLDILSWLVGSLAERVSSRGSVTHYHAGSAPEGGPERCLDGCPIFDQCPHNAKTFYVDEMGNSPGWPVNMVSPVPTVEARMEALRTGPYGRCVYKCDNTQPDLQMTSIDFRNGTTAELTTTAFSAEDTRTLRIHGTLGEIRAHMLEGRIEVRRFAGSTTPGIRPFGTGETQVVTVETSPGHQLGDAALTAAFVDLLGGAEEEPATSWNRSVESHWMAFAAERSRAQDSAWIPMTDLR